MFPRLALKVCHHLARVRIFYADSRVKLQQELLEIVWNSRNRIPIIFEFPIIDLEFKPSSLHRVLGMYY